MQPLVYVLNQFIRTDLGFKAALSEFEGKVICFSFEAREPFTLQIKDTAFEPLQNDIVPDLIVQGTPMNLLRYASSKFVHPAMNYGIQLDGDMAFVNAFINTCNHFKIEWARLLTLLTHEQISLTITKLAPKIGQAYSKNKQHLNHSVTQFLQAELKVLPSKIQCQDFSEDVEQLRQDVDNFEARLHSLLEAHHDH